MSHLEISPLIAEALAEGRPVVALESTIFAHGMAYPDNVHTALELEAIVRGTGAMPATIAVIGGRMKAGLTGDEIERIGRAGPGIAKVSSRDLPFVIARGVDGATTVAATMRIAALAGILVFATGGVGGVHRNVESSFDISADLTELSRTPVAVVSAGAKAILDLPRTLEMLETLAVPVIGYRTDEFPAFYSRSSGLALTMRCDTADEIAAVMQAQRVAGLRGGLLVANPIPEADEIPASEIMPVIETAVAEAAKAGIGGKEVTPFLLARVAAATSGRSLVANVALARNNARLAGEIAIALSAISPSPLAGEGGARERGR